jgi:type I restriction enzyme S subunit
MTSGLKPYPAYKDSGVPWLGTVPEHWEIRRLRNTVEMRVSNVDKHTNEHEVPIRLCNYIDVYKNERITDRITFMRATASRDEIAHFRPESGDVLITKDSEMWNDIGVPALVEYTASDLVCGYHLALLRPFKGLMDGGYLFRALQSPPVAYQFHVSANGVTRYGLSHDAIKSVVLPVPPFPEQAAIIRFLDHADRRIRRYIRAKQKLIKLLEEQKQAIIHRAVTRGLDPNVRLKPSGVEWLGEVPESWEILRTRYLFREVDCRSKAGTETHLSMSQKLGLVPSSMVEQRTLVSLSYTGAKLCEEDDLVLNRLKAHLGVFALARQSGVISPDYTVLRKIRPMVVQYFEHVLRCPACRGELRVRAKGIVEGFWRLYTDDFYNIRLPVPSENDQRQIVDAIDVATESIRATIRQNEQEIALLREYRTLLIADVVTGKLDVRDAAQHLQAEAEELELLDDVEALADGEEDGEDADLDPTQEKPPDE